MRSLKSRTLLIIMYYFLIKIPYFNYSAYHEIVTFFRFFWEFFKNCQLKTLLNTKFVKSLRFFENIIVTIWWCNMHHISLLKSLG